MNPQQPKKLRKLLALRALRRLRPDAYVEWAVEALVDGVDTPALRILAGLDRMAVWSEVEHYFQAALTELELEIPAGDEAVQRYVRDLAADIVAGAVTPADGCRAIYRIWLALQYLELDYPDDLGRWVFLDEELDPEGFSDLHGPALDEAIRREAARLLE